MSARRRKRPVRPQRPGGPRPPVVRSRTAWQVRPAREQIGWQLVPPRCCDERVDDMLEVDEMVAVGEWEAARDELRFLLSECPDFFAAHQKLGELALEEQDYALARGHFGYVHDTVLKVLASVDAPDGPLPYAIAENQPAHESSKGLAWSLHHTGRDDLALFVVARLLRWDPNDPLGVRPWLSTWKTAD